MMKKILSKLSKYAAMGVLLLPFSTSKILPPALTHNGNGLRTGKTENNPEPETEKLIDIMHIFSDSSNREYVRFIINNTTNQIDLGIHPGGVSSRYLVAEETNQTISTVFQDESLDKVLSIFHPSLSEADKKNYLKNFKILVGHDIDYYLETVRKGSWGTTVMSVDKAGKVHFESLSLKSFLVTSSPQVNPDILQKLVVEEFFQAHQYDTIAAQLYNNGYLSEVAKINTPESLMKEISIGNLRAFMELFPQQKYLFDINTGVNSYNYYIGDQLYDNATNSPDAISLPYEKLVDFIQKQLGINTEPTDFLNPESIRHINDDFRSIYMDFYLKQGYSNDQIQIWNLVGMKRTHRQNPENSLDIQALLTLPPKSI